MKVSCCAVEAAIGVGAVLATFYNVRAGLAFTLVKIVIVVSNTFSAFLRSNTVQTKDVLLTATFTEAAINVKFVLAGVAYEIAKATATAGCASQVNISTLNALS